MFLFQLSFSDSFFAGFETEDIHSISLMLIKIQTNAALRKFYVETKT